ncbi:MAG: hydrolase [Betaproteobacteria bacterium]|nr:hydrolase [Betaproteobacteria bacterium]
MSARSPLPAAPYRAPKWLPGGHAQTIYPLLIKPEPPPFRRGRWETPDGDFIDLDWKSTSLPSAVDQSAPLVVLFHGLEGSSDSHYAISLMRALSAVGWDGVVVHFRGCSGQINRLPRAYHSGDSEEIDWILRRLKQQFPARPLYAVGVSLGGNALLKWLGERGSGAGELIRAAAAISAPLDLTACGHHLGRGFNRVYTQHFLHTLKRNAAAKLQLFPDIFDAKRMHAACTLYQFDDAVTAPLHGFAGADDYWLRASSKPWLAAIRLPTLLLNALNDPFLPADALPAADQLSSSVTAEFPRQGGHVGFVGGGLPGHLDWLPQRILHFFQHEV